MVRGLDRFREFFRDFQDQYILICGAACDIILSKSNFEFRVTRDLDIVLIAEALTTEFGRRFWEFIEEGGYANLDKSDGTPQYFRFTEPSSYDPHRNWNYLREQIPFLAMRQEGINH